MLVPTRCPSGIALTSKKRCQSCVASRMQRMQLISKDGRKALPRLCGNVKILGGIPHLRHHRDDGLDTIERGNLWKSVNCLFNLWTESHNEFSAKVTAAKFGNSQRSSLSPTGWCKEYTSYNRKLDTKTENIQHEQRHEHWGQAWDKPHQQQVRWREHRHAQDAQHLSMHWERVVFVFLL